MKLRACQPKLCKVLLKRSPRRHNHYSRAHIHHFITQVQLLHLSMYYNQASIPLSVSRLSPFCASPALIRLALCLLESSMGCMYARAGRQLRSSDNQIQANISLQPHLPYNSSSASLMLEHCYSLCRCLRRSGAFASALTFCASLPLLPTLSRRRVPCLS